MRSYLMGILISLLLLSACAAPQTTPTATSLPPTATGTPIPAPTPTATPRPPVRLTVCSATLPESLFPYDGMNPPIKTNLLAMLQDGPMDRIGDTLEPVILEALPSIDNGGIILEATAVQPGQTVVDARGELVVLKPGVTLRPAGCRETACAVVWDGSTPLEMDQMVVTYRILDGVAWSDGTPLTATDSVFSFALASAPDAPGLGWAEARTETYAAADDHTVVWTGKPGFTTADLARFFWVPLPAFAVGAEIAWAEARDAVALAEGGLAYGPFYVASWTESGLLLARNPHYFRSAEGLPRVDEIFVTRVDGGPEAAWEAMQSGACDILDDSFAIASRPDLVAEIRESSGYALRIQEELAWMQLVFGIRPASHDDYYNPVYGDRPDIFGTAGVRKAFAQCLDRGSLKALFPEGLAPGWDSFLPPDRSAASATFPAYDPQGGAQALEGLGWMDHDLDPETPRQAWGVANVPDGTRLEVSLFASQAGSSPEIAAAVGDSLQACGIGVALQEMPAQTLFAPGPEGPLFGRQFDLALLSWQAMPEPDCAYYQSWRIPTDDNHWIGTNLAGYSDATYDRLCAEAALTLPGERLETLSFAEDHFLAELPAIPLYGHTALLILRKGLCQTAGGAVPAGFFEGIETLAGEENCP